MTLVHVLPHVALSKPCYVLSTNAGKSLLSRVRLNASLRAAGCAEYHDNHRKTLVHTVGGIKESQFNLLACR